MTTPLILGLAMIFSACGQDVSSQEQYFTPTPARTAVQDSIAAGRLNAITRAVEAASPAVVSVNVTQRIRTYARDPFSDPFYDLLFGRQRARVLERQIQSMGSGFVISKDGYIVTNEHVARGATAVTVAFPNGRTYPAELIGTDVASDLALLKIDTEDELASLTFSGAGDPIVGEWSIALGNPFGLFEASDPTVTVGVVSAKGRDLTPKDGHLYRDMIQTDAAINRGNSGGPLLNALGEVIGVNAAIYSESGGSIGIGFAVPAHRAIRVLNELRQYGSVDRSYYTGMIGRDVTLRVARYLRLSRTGGVLVERVEPNSPAEYAGFRPWDVITSIASKPVNDRNDFLARLYDFRPGDTVEVGIIRGAEPRTLVLILGSDGTR